MEDQTERKQMEKRTFDKLTVKHYEYADLEKLMGKLQQLNEEQLKDIPSILGAKTEKEEFDLDLEQMSDENLSKLEFYCDSILNI